MNVLCLVFLSIAEFSVFSFAQISRGHVGWAVKEAPFSPVHIATIKIGNPPQTLTVLINTGSNLSWLPCQFCSDNCSEANLNQYNPSMSTTISFVRCPQKWCRCSQNHLCEYVTTYEDKSTASGYFVEDLIWIESNNSWARLSFGCGTYHSESLLSENRGFDGVLGFGPGPYSIPAQFRLNSFSYCFNSGIEDGFLLFGEAIHPDLMYTPMTLITQQYALSLEKIMVDGQILPIEPAIFRPSKKGDGTVIDSGTSHFLLIEEAYDVLITAIKFFVPSTTYHLSLGKFDCFTITSSISEAFPIVTLVFSQNATLVLPPNQYLRKYYYNDMENTTSTWCIDIVKWKSRTCLGGYIFRNKLVVHDLARERVGWANYDCSTLGKELPVDIYFITGNATNHRSVGNRYMTYVFVGTLVGLYVLALLIVILFRCG